MAVSEVLFGSVLVVILVLLSLVFGVRQVRELRRLRGLTLPEEEMRYERRKAWRRLVSSGLTLILAILLGGQLLLHEPDAGRLAQEREGYDATNAPAFTDEQKLFLRIWGGTWIALLLVLLAVLILAAIDLWATRRYALKQYRKIQADRRAMIQRQTARLRQERNGQDG